MSMLIAWVISRSEVGIVSDTPRIRPNSRTEPLLVHKMRWDGEVRYVVMFIVWFI